MVFDEIFKKLTYIAYLYRFLALFEISYDFWILELASLDWFQYKGYVSHSFLAKELDFKCRIRKLHQSWKLPEISWNSGYCPGIGQFWLISIHRVYFPLNFSQGTWFSMQNLKITSFLEVSRAISRVPGNFWKFPGMM